MCLCVTLWTFKLSHVCKVPFCQRRWPRHTGFRAFKYRPVFLGISGSVMCKSLRPPWTVAPPGSSVHGMLQARLLEWAPPLYFFFSLCFFALITEEGFLISLCSSLELCIQMVYLSFSPLPFASLLFIAICKTSPDNHFAFCISLW